MDTITQQLNSLFNEALKPHERIKAGVQARKLIREKMTEVQKSVARPKKESAPVQ